MYCKHCGQQILEEVRFCPYCGQAIMQESTVPQVDTTFYPGGFGSKEQTDLPFRTGKLVIGILSIVLSMLVLFQSCAVGILNNMEQSNDVGGTAGVVLVVIWWVAGIIGIAGRKSKSATIAGGVCYGLAAVIGILNSAVFSDLLIYGVVSIAFAVVFMLSAFRAERKIY